MPSRIDVATTALTSLQPDEATAAPPSPQRQRAGNSVEAHSGSGVAFEAAAAPTDSETASAAALEQQQRAERAQRDLARRAGAQLSPLFDLAAKRGKIDAATFITGRDQSDVLSAMRRLPHEAFRELVGDQIAVAFPGATASTQAELTGAALRALGDAAKGSLARELRDTASALLKDGASHFSAAAQDPKQLEALLHSLAQGMPDERAQRLAALGVNHATGTPSVQELQRALSARADEMQAEAQRLAKTTQHANVLNELSGLDLSVLSARCAVAPDSFAAQQLEATKADASAEHLRRQVLMIALKLSTAAAMGGAGAGLGFVGSAASSATSMSLSAISLGQAENAVRSARATESAGVTAAGTAHHAEHHQTATRIATAFEAAAPFTVGKALHAGFHALFHGAGDATLGAAAEATATAGILGAEHAAVSGGPAPAPAPGVDATRW